MTKLKLTGCTLPCAYALSDTGLCTCPCGGKYHGLLSNRPQIVPLKKCSPAAEKRCKAGNEDGSCACACGGDNHGIYKHIADFENTVRVSHYA